MVILKKIWTYLVIIAMAMLSAVSYELFVFPNQFAPSGLTGICTMIQHITGISVGYLSLLINVPLAIWVYIEVSKPIATRSLLYVTMFSLGLIVLDHVDISAFAYTSDSGKIMGPLVAGVISGYVYSVLARASAYSGGTDFISAVIHHRDPNKSVYGVTFAMNVCIAVTSYFVYDYHMEPVILCILYSFTSSTVVDRLIKSGRTAIRFEIVTESPQELSQAIIEKFKHSVTMLKGKGMYSGKDRSVLICVVNKTQAAALAALVRSFPNSFAVMSQVGQVVGNFKNMSKDGKEVTQILDSGNGETL